MNNKKTCEMGDFQEEMASEVRDGLPPHGDGTPHRLCSGVSKTRGGERRHSFLQALVNSESPQSQKKTKNKQTNKQKKTDSNFCKSK